MRAGGTVTEATGDGFPVLEGNDAASFLLVLKPGAVREPHWHPNAWEMDVPLSGRGRLGVRTWTTRHPERRVDLPARPSASRTSSRPQGYAHYIENTGKEDMRWVVVFNNTHPTDIGL